MIANGEKRYIGTTRFSDATWEENVRWRKKHEWRGCMYGLTKGIAKKVPRMALVYVLEMNNTTNQIMGIGLIRNFTNENHTSIVYYSDPDYNRRIYNSAYRRDRSEIANKKMLAALENLVFKGSRHFKRGQGITVVPMKRFRGDNIQSLVSAFFFSLFK